MNAAQWASAPVLAQRMYINSLLDGDKTASVCHWFHWSKQMYTARNNQQYKLN